MSVMMSNFPDSVTFKSFPLQITLSEQQRMWKSLHKTYSYFELIFESESQKPWKVGALGIEASDWVSAA